MKCLAFPWQDWLQGLNNSGWDLGLREQRDGSKGSHWMMGLGGVSSSTSLESIFREKKKNAVKIINFWSLRVFSTHYSGNLLLDISSAMLMKA